MSLVVLEGLRPWLIQRLSALVIACWLLYVVASLLCLDSVDYHAWRAWIHQPFNNLFTGLFVLATLFHAWIGMRDVVLDYVHHFVPRLVMLTVILLSLVLCGLWSLRVLLAPLVE